MNVLEKYLIDMDVYDDVKKFSKDVKDLFDHFKKLMNVYFGRFIAISNLDVRMTIIVFGVPTEDYYIPYNNRFSSIVYKKKAYHDNRIVIDKLFNEIKEDIKIDLVFMRRVWKDLIEVIEKIEKMFKDNPSVTILYNEKYFSILKPKLLKNLIETKNKFIEIQKISDRELTDIISQEKYYKGYSRDLDNRAFLLMAENSYRNIIGDRK